MQSLISDNTVIEKLKFYKLDIEQFFTIYISSGGDINAQDNLGNTPLFCAVQHCNIEMINVLIRLGADISIRGVLNHTPLTLAASLGNIEAIRSILSSPGVNVNKRIASYTPLHLAVMYSHVGAVKKLLKHPNIEVNARCNATIGEYNRGIDISLSNSFKQYQQRYKQNLRIQNGGDNITALHYAIYYNDKEMIKLLLQHRKIDLYATDGNGRNTLEYLKLYYDNKKKWHIDKCDQLRKYATKESNKKSYHEYIKILFIVVLSAIFVAVFFFVNNIFVQVALTSLVVIGILCYKRVDNHRKYEQERQNVQDQQVMQNIQEEYEQRNAEITELIQQAEHEQATREAQAREEAEQKVAQEAQEKEEFKQKAEQEAQRANKLAEALEKMGVDLNTVLNDVNISQGASASAERSE